MKKNSKPKLEKEMQPKKKSSNNIDHQMKLRLLELAIEFSTAYDNGASFEEKLEEVEIAVGKFMYFMENTV